MKPTCLPPPPELKQALAAVEQRCTGCGACVRECGFLQKHGNPGAIARSFDDSTAAFGTAYECSLCGLCAAVCPEGVAPEGLFHRVRTAAVERGFGPLPEHAGLLAYERKGTSRLFSFYALPAGCETVFFPGCALAGTRAEAVRGLYRQLQQRHPDLGIVLDCCTKPSLDLGRREAFQALFGEMHEWLQQHGVRRVLVACPNCHKVFSQYGEGLQVETVYEALLDCSLLAAEPVAATLTVHDSCVLRHRPEVQGAVRELARRQGATIDEMPHSGLMSICCGEGAGAGSVNPELAAGWRRLRRKEAAGRRVLTYCAGCSHILGGEMPASHVVDLLTDPQAAIAGAVKAARAPATYLQRLRLKRHFRRTVPAAISRERDFAPDRAIRRKQALRSLAMFTVLIGAIALVRTSGAGEWLEQERLRSLIAAWGGWAPLIYMLVYALAPALFLPGLPITIAGGILFGPLWGVVYTITSATAGACLAFLVSRYLARDWVRSRLTSPRWRTLDREVEKHGWKVVAFTRLVPLFPFNLLNYALGLTGIRFSHYAVATFFCMLPACIAFIVFSSSLLDLLQGKVSVGLLIGLLLVAAVSFLPAVYRQRRQTAGSADN